MGPLASPDIGKSAGEWESWRARRDDLQVRSTDLIRQLPLMAGANAATSPCKSLFLLAGAPEEIRTPDL